jgi:hypothetical protein
MCASAVIPAQRAGIFPNSQTTASKYMKAIDSSAKTTGQGGNLAGGGYGAVGVYLRSGRCTAAMIAELHTAGLQVWSVYEKGYSTSDVYFSAAKGTSDGTAAATFAKSMGQPKGTQIYATVDYDPTLPQNSVARIVPSLAS